MRICSYARGAIADQSEQVTDQSLRKHRRYDPIRIPALFFVQEIENGMSGSHLRVRITLLNPLPQPMQTLLVEALALASERCVLYCTYRLVPTRVLRLRARRLVYLPPLSVP